LTQPSSKQLMISCETHAMRLYSFTITWRPSVNRRQQPPACVIPDRRNFDPQYKKQSTIPRTPSFLSERCQSTSRQNSNRSCSSGWYYQPSGSHMYVVA